MRLAILALALALSASTARAEHTRMTYPDVFSVEALGRGLTFSLCYDRVLTDDLVAGIGFGRTTADAPSDPAATVIPFYVNYYFSRDQGSLYATAGATIVGNSDGVEGSKAKFSDVRFGSSPILGTAGVGYENRADSGILFRVAVYGVAGGTVVPWVGFTVGYGF